MSKNACSNKNGRFIKVSERLLFWQILVEFCRSKISLAEN